MNLASFVAVVVFRDLTTDGAVSSSSLKPEVADGEPTLLRAPGRCEKDSPVGAPVCEVLGADADVVGGRCGG